MSAARVLAGGALGGLIGVAIDKVFFNASEPWKQTKFQNPPLRLSIFAPPGGGKGTLCTRIVKEYGLVQISSGDIFRAEVKKGTDLGKQLKKSMDTGHLVPADTANAIMVHAVQECADKGESYILDGCIREHANAQLFCEANLGPDVSIILDVSREECVNRVAGRRIDPVTKKSYHVRFVHAENEEIERRLVQRDDDKPQVINKRYMQYEKNLEGCLEPLYRTGHVVKVDGTGKPDEVFARVKVEIDRALARKQLDEVIKDGSKAPEALMMLAWLGLRG